MLEIQENKIKKLYEKYPKFYVISHKYTKCIWGGFETVDKRFFVFTITLNGKVFYGCWVFETAKEMEKCEKELGFNFKNQNHIQSYFSKKENLITEYKK